MPSNTTSATVFATSPISSPESYKNPGNISLSIANADGELLLHRLDLKGIEVATGSACDSVNNQISHVIRVIGFPEKYARGTIRISLGVENAREDIDIIVRELSDIVSGLQRENNFMGE